MEVRSADPGVAVTSPRSRRAEDRNRPAADLSRNLADATIPGSNLALSRDLLAETALPAAVKAKEINGKIYVSWKGSLRRSFSHVKNLTGEGCSDILL